MPYRCRKCDAVIYNSSDEYNAHLNSAVHIANMVILATEYATIPKEQLIKVFGTDDTKMLIAIFESGGEFTDTAVNKTSIVLPNTIFNKEALRDKIHEIHNFMRNSGTGYGMNALKVFNVFYGLMKIEENGLLEKIGLPKTPACSFKYLLSLADETFNDLCNEKLLTTVRNETLYAIMDSKVVEFLLHDVPPLITPSALAYLIKEISKLSEIEKACNVQLAGKIYEYFVGRSRTDKSDLGAHFTDRHITSFVINELDIEIKDGKLPRTVDMFGGSGGFTTSFIQHVNKDINWAEEINKIYHYDINPDVVRSAALEIFCLTGEAPDKRNVGYKNSFTDGWGDTYEESHFDLILGNPPYGGDTYETGRHSPMIKFLEAKKKEKITFEEQIIIRNQLNLYKQKEKEELEVARRFTVSVENSSKHIRQYCDQYKLNGNDKESVSLILFMSCLAPGGICAVVLKEGVFFAPKYKSLREFLVNKFEVSKIISIANNQFENTTTKTSVLIFKNTGNPTSKVDFYDLCVDKYKEDKFELINYMYVQTECKDAISEVYKTYRSSATLNEIKLKDYTLAYNFYNFKDMIPGDGYTIVKLFDVCNMENGTIITKEKSTPGQYPVYGGGNVSYYIDKYNREGWTLILSKHGISKICVRLIDDKIFLSSDAGSLKPKENNELLSFYINHLLLTNKVQKYIYEKLTNGSIQKHIDTKLFQEFKIPIPNQDKINYWGCNLQNLYAGIAGKKEELKNQEDLIFKKVEQIINTNTRQKEYTIKDLFDITYGDKHKSYDSDELVLQIGGGALEVNYKFVKTWNIESNVILMSAVCDAGYVSIFNEKVNANKNVYIFTQKIQNYNINKYIYYYLKINENKLKSMAKGSIQVWLNRDKIYEFKVYIPPIDDISTQISESMFSNIDSIKNDINTFKKEYKKLSVMLENEAIKDS